jgi:hypothetical protein
MANARRENLLVICGIGLLELLIRMRCNASQARDVLALRSAKIPGELKEIIGGSAE